MSFEKWASGEQFFLNDFQPYTTTVSGKRGTQGTSLADMQEKQNVETKKREEEVRSYFDQIIKMYEPGGGFGKGMEAVLDRQKMQSTAQGTQALVSSGLANTTQQAGLGKKFEEEVGMPTRMKLEDLRTQNYASAIGQKAQMVTDIQQDPMDYALLAQLLQTSSSS